MRRTPGPGLAGCPASRLQRSAVQHPRGPTEHAGLAVQCCTEPPPSLFQPLTAWQERTHTLHLREPRGKLVQQLDVGCPASRDALPQQLRRAAGRVERGQHLAEGRQGGDVPQGPCPRPCLSCPEQPRRRQQQAPTKLIRAQMRSSPTEQLGRPHCRRTCSKWCRLSGSISSIEPPPCASALQRRQRQQSVQRGTHFLSHRACSPVP